MEILKKLVCISFCLFMLSATSASEIEWIEGLEGPDAWTIDPCEPGQNDTISFSGPVGPVTNSCFAITYLGGTPSISVDDVNKVVELWFEGSVPDICPLIWAPVCGLSGQFGPLSPGSWTFESTQSSIAFEVPFTVASMGK
ncbi:MAG: hypothetical protein P8016_14475, partial [Sedimentisphaerales bacterium]